MRLPLEERTRLDHPYFFPFVFFHCSFWWLGLSLSCFCLFFFVRLSGCQDIDNISARCPFGRYDCPWQKEWKMKCEWSDILFYFIVRVILVFLCLVKLTKFRIVLAPISPISDSFFHTTVPPTVGHSVGHSRILKPISRTLEQNRSRVNKGHIKGRKKVVSEVKKGASTKAIGKLCGVIEFNWKIGKKKRWKIFILAKHGQMAQTTSIHRTSSIQHWVTRKGRVRFAQGTRERAREMKERNRAEK